MDRTKLTIEVTDFKALVKAVSRFPSVGAFGGSDELNLSCHDDKLRAWTFGVVLSNARVSAHGIAPLFAVDRRVIESFASICPEKGTVTFQLTDSELICSCKQRQISIARSEGHIYKLPVVKDVAPIKITRSMAERVVYLSSVALDDSTRAELACVMLTKHSTIACNQKTVAVLPGSKVGSNTALPLPLAKIIETGDVVYVGARETLVKSGIGTYSMASPVKAQKEFPLAAITAFKKAKRTEVAVCEADKFTTAITECATCLGQLARTEVISTLQTDGSRITLSSKNGGAKFEVSIPLVLEAKEATIFKLPLQGLIEIAPFMKGRVVLARGERGEVYVMIEDGWVMFPSWEARKKAKK